MLITGFNFLLLGDIAPLNQCLQDWSPGEFYPISCFIMKDSYSLTHHVSTVIYINLSVLKRCTVPADTLEWSIKFTSLKALTAIAILLWLGIKTPPNQHTRAIFIVVISIHQIAMLSTKCWKVPWRQKYRREITHRPGALEDAFVLEEVLQWWEHHMPEPVFCGKGGNRISFHMTFY